MAGDFGATSAKVENAGSGPDVICTNANADWGSSIPAGITLGLGANCGRLVSKTTLSGSFSIELILMVGLAVLACTGSMASGSIQFTANSSMRSAGPTTQK